MVKHEINMHTFTNMWLIVRCCGRRRSCTLPSVDQENCKEGMTQSHWLISTDRQNACVASVCFFSLFVQSKTLHMFFCAFVSINVRSDDTFQDQEREREIPKKNDDEALFKPTVNEAFLTIYGCGMDGLTLGMTYATQSLAQLSKWMLKCGAAIDRNGIYTRADASQLIYASEC